MSVTCPICHGDVTQTDTGVHCEHCHQNFTLEADCPDCGQALEVLKACGAVDYFCRNGHGLISKKRVVFVPTVT
ncbi:zinc ribbon domain-containing protein [Citrobacter sp. JGM124]|uniref:zinc ribbon domain-containing protein n=1 Tax=Citrobacter sp. JGM124 TaxID=2799789 RepID=UPI001BA9910A|nr:zinc ribbon domain-containing protein [Citrobacter sp. JGM124]MBS0849025.1 zinc ribbon domain-containing protein [Citrobacter sp. JGM124]